MNSDDKFATAAHLYVLLRRKCGRVVDTVWMGQSVDYAREVIRIARDQADPDLARLAARLEGLMALGAKSVAPAAAPVSVEPSESPQKYVTSLR